MKRIFIFALMSACMVLISNDMTAQKKGRKKKKDKDQTEEPKEEKSDFDEKIAGCTKYEGLFNVYIDTADGKSYLEIREDQLDKEYIYFSYIENGLLEAGAFKGSYRGSKVISFSKSYENIEIYAENTAYYFDESSPLSKASNTNINRPLLVSEKLHSKNKDGDRFLISGDAIFVSEKLQMVKPPSRPMAPSFLGNLSSSKSKVKSVNNYPENTEVRVKYVYDNGSPRSFGGPATTDARSITLEYQHSILAMPDNDFQPRKDDGRVGYFMTQTTDLTTLESIPYKDMIHRWHLEKKDPMAELSEPVEPIVWWIENTTPLEFRDIIKAGVERWNQSFEKAGFKNAVVAKVQPDDAEWDAGDIRYNVLRWTSSPTPPFGGYGPSFVNPRTGQILGADVMLEFISVSRRLFVSESFETAAVMMDSDFENTDYFDQPYQCELADHMHNNLMFGLSSAKVMGLGEATEKDIVAQTLYRLTLHEVGHTLGLTHNMRASTLLSVDEIKDKKKVNTMGMCNSVMEYPSINFALNKEEQTLFYDVKPGLYDDWVIEYGYSEGLKDPEAEEKRLAKILERSSDPNLAYGNDADDMRSTGRGMDPDVNIYDLSDDPVAYAIDRCKLVNKTIPKLLEKYSEEGDSYQKFTQSFMVMTGEYATQLRIMTRQIGGVHYDRSHVGQDTQNKPLTPVSEKDQKAAMDALTKYAFAPDVMSYDKDLIQHLLPQRRGFNHFVSAQDPKLNGRISNIQYGALSHFMNNNVIQRISDSELYGNTYSVTEVYNDLTSAIFKADLRSKVITSRQNLQTMYTESLIRMANAKKGYGMTAKRMANYQLEEILKMMRANGGKDVDTKAHRRYIIKLINDYKEA